MGSSVREELAEAPETVAVLHLASSAPLESRLPTELSTSNSGSVATLSMNLVSPTNSNAKALVQKYAANIFQREEANDFAIDNADSETSLPLTSDYISPHAQVEHVSRSTEFAIENLTFSSHCFSLSVRSSNSSMDGSTETTAFSNTSLATTPPKDQTTGLEATQIMPPITLAGASAVLRELQDSLEGKDCDNTLQVPNRHQDSLTDQTEIRPSAHKAEMSPTWANLFKTLLKHLFTSAITPKKKEVDTDHGLANITTNLMQEDKSEHEESTDVEDDGVLADDDKWAQVRDIPNEKYCKLVLGACDPFREVKPNHIGVVGHCEGAFHRVTFVRLYRNSEFENFVVRVPAHGTPELWTKEDSYMMEREVDLMRYVAHHTETPIAQLFDHDTGCDNTLGMPYIVETRLAGIPAYKIWFEEGKDYDPELALRNGDYPSKETEIKRVIFLRSLARVMNELGTLQFDQSGSLIAKYTSARPQTATSGPHYTWTHKHIPGSSTQQIIQVPLDDFCNIDAECAERGDRWHRDTGFCRRVGMRKILDMVFSTPAFNQGAANFTIWHPDLDLQNILTDENGNVTGIIDWDGVFLAPRCMGASSVPKFLNRDWFPAEVGGLYSFPNLIWRSDHYRSLYAAAMIREAPMQEHPDGHFISKSAIYTAAIACVMKLIGAGDEEDFVIKLLQSISRLNRIPVEEYLVEIGRGMVEEEKLLKHDIDVLLEPQLPEDNYFELLRTITEQSTSSSAPSSVDGVEAASCGSCKTQTS